MLRRVILSLHALANPRMLTVHGMGARCASRDSTVWIGQKWAQPGQDPRAKDHFTEDPDPEEFEEQVLALERQEKRRRTAIKVQRIQKQLGFPGAEDRKLSWDAMEQIRYLKQEFPEEWTVTRLAEGFSVSTDVIRRVLRSRFIPSPERRAKQDAKAAARTHQPSLPVSPHPGKDRPQLPESHNIPLPLPAGTGSDLATLDHFTPQGQDLATTAPSGGGDSTGFLTLLPNPPLPVLSSTTQQQLQTDHQSSSAQEEMEEEEEDSWDGMVLSDHELEELVTTHTEQNSRVVQKGSEFFDSKGNFLYRI